MLVDLNNFTYVYTRKSINKLTRKSNFCINAQRKLPVKKYK